MTFPAIAEIPVNDTLETARARERFLRALSLSIFLLFFQTYMVAPLIPSLAANFRVSQETVGLLVPAYTIPYAITALLCGVLADRLGRRGLLLFSVAAFAVLGAAMACAPSVYWLIGLRAVSGLSNAGIAVMGLTLVGDLFPQRERGHALGWVFGAIAGGGAFGSTLGGVLAPIIGWRGLFVMTAVLGAVVLVRISQFWSVLKIELPPPSRAADVVWGYVSLLKTKRGARTYSFIFLNAAFHSGLFTWFGVHLHERYGLGEAGIGLALLGYGVPGFLLGPFIGRIVDRYGRRHLIPAGFMAASLAAFLLAPRWPIMAAVLAAPLLSFGFDMSHPLLAGIATMLDGRRRGQAMGLNTFSIFFGFGWGSLLFGALAVHGTARALVIFAIAQAILGLAAMVAFRSE